MNTNFRKPLAGTGVDYFDTRAAVDAIKPGSYATLPYTSRVLAENLVRRCDPEMLNDALSQLINRKRDLDFPWFPARVVCHDILGQTALVDLAGLRDAIAAKGGDPAKVNPVVPTQLIVDHSLAVEHAGFEPDAFEKNRAIEDRRNDDRFHFINWTKTAFKNIDVIPPGNGIMHQINLEKMSPVIQKRDGVAFPDTLVGTDSHTPMVDALGVIAVGVGGLEAESVMLGRASYMRLPDIIGVELTGKPQPGITATDIVLALTEFLRKEKVVSSYLEFYGEGASALTIGDRILARTEEAGRGWVAHPMKKLAKATEMLLGGQGLGAMIYNAGFSLLWDQMYALMFIIGLLGIAMNFLVAAVRYPLAGWQSRYSAMGAAA